MALAAALFMAVAAGLYLYFQEEAHPPSVSCPARASGIDIGSGSTKLLIADVDPCQKQLLRVVHRESVKVDYKHDLSFHGGNLSRPVRAEGVAVLKKYLATIERLEARAPVVIATEALRQARNSAEFLDQVRNELNFEIQIIEQSLEAELSFFSVVAVTEHRAEDTVVWDIGGGSQQISYWQDGELQSHLIPWGSITFKEKVAEALGRTALSPNPFTWEEVQVAQDLVEVQGRFPSARKTVVGVGGVFNHSLLPRLDSPDARVHRLDLESLLARIYFFTDEQLESEYAETDITNVIMVTELMELFEVPEVLVMQLSSLEGALIAPELLNH